MHMLALTGIFLQSLQECLSGRRKKNTLRFQMIYHIYAAAKKNLIRSQLTPQLDNDQFKCPGINVP